MKGPGPGGSACAPGPAGDPSAFFPRPRRLPPAGELAAALPRRDRRALPAVARPMRYRALLRRVRQGAPQCRGAAQRERGEGGGVRRPARGLCVNSEGGGEGSAVGIDPVCQL